MKKNIVLIGMPGSGKTTLARLLSKQLDREYIDLDTEIEQVTQKNIRMLFEQGEEHFREIETQVTKQVSQKTPLIIATGGGIVLRKENMNALREYGLLIFLNRSLEHIASDVEVSTRPLLQEGKGRLQALYNDRFDLYMQYADIIVENNDRPETAVNEIINQIDHFKEKGEASE